jgi:hypothetical protein
MKERVTEEKAKEVVKNFLISRNLSKFVDDISDWSSWYGRFGSKNRYYFIGKVKELLEERDIGLI